VSLTALKKNLESLALAFPTLDTSREMINIQDTLNGTLDLLTRGVGSDMSKLSSGLERRAQGTISLPIVSDITINRLNLLSIRRETPTVTKLAITTATLEAPSGCAIYSA